MEYWWHYCRVILREVMLGYFQFNFHHFWSSQNVFRWNVTLTVRLPRRFNLLTSVISWFFLLAPLPGSHLFVSEIYQPLFDRLLWHQISFLYLIKKLWKVLSCTFYGLWPNILTSNWLPICLSCPLCFVLIIKFYHINRLN